jgi:hypothetical protein
MPPALDVRTLLRQARAAVEEARPRSYRYRAWQRLLDTDSDGLVRCVLPWDCAAGLNADTTPALAELKLAHERDPDDPVIVHHLAIAQHARAWDLELAGDARALAAWTEALAWWRLLASSSAFWTALEQKLLACKPRADVAVVRQLRRDLLEHLMGVHVDFVRHYVEQNAPDRAVGHIEVIRRALLPPVLRTKMTERIFDAMTSIVPESRLRGEFTAALATLERFLSLFPTHLPALRLHAEVCRDWVSGRSFTEWPEIQEVARRADPCARRLAAHPDLAGDPLAADALVSLASELARRGNDRARKCFTGVRFEDITTADRQVMSESLELSQLWARLAAPYSPGGSLLQMLLVECLHNRSFLLHRQAEQTLAHNGHQPRFLRAALAAYRQAIAETEEALRYRPEEQVLAQNLTGLRARAAELAMELDLFGGEEQP